MIYCSRWFRKPVCCELYYINYSSVKYVGLSFSKKSLISMASKSELNSLKQHFFIMSQCYRSEAQAWHGEVLCLGAHWLKWRCQLDVFSCETEVFFQADVVVGRISCGYGIKVSLFLPAVNQELFSAVRGDLKFLLCDPLQNMAVCFFKTGRQILYLPISCFRKSPIPFQGSPIGQGHPG